MGPPLLRGPRRSRPAAAAPDYTLVCDEPGNTGIGARVILIALAVLRGGTLTDFASALLIGLGIGIGIVVGSYSSLLTAAPLAVQLQGRCPGAPPAARRPRPTKRDPLDSGAVV